MVPPQCYLRRSRDGKTRITWKVPRHGLAKWYNPSCHLQALLCTTDQLSIHEDFADIPVITEEDELLQHRLRLILVAFP